MTEGGIPHVLFSHPGTRQVISRQFETKRSAWTTDVLSPVFGTVAPPISVATKGDPVAAAWADANPNNPQALALDLRIAINDGSGAWQVSTVCTACVGNREQIDITFSPDGFPVIAYVNPLNQLMVAYDPPALGPPGDYNRDGSVDASDYVVWRQMDGTQGGYDVWRSNFGRSAALNSAAGSVGGASIPEPQSIVFACSLLVLFVITHGRRGATAVSITAIARYCPRTSAMISSKEPS
jgi:hypothetical protein